MQDFFVTTTCAQEIGIPRNCANSALVAAESFDYLALGRVPNLEET
jgi:hypothetical protein